MWWCKRNAAWGRVARLAVVLAAAGLTAGCFQPLNFLHATDIGCHSQNAGRTIRRSSGKNRSCMRKPANVGVKKGTLLSME